MRKLTLSLSSVLILVFIVTCYPSIGFGKEEITEEILDNYLFQNGYPEDVVEILEIEQKKSLMEQGGVYKSHSTSHNNLLENMERLSEQEKKAVEAHFEKVYGDASLMALSNFTSSLVISQVNTTVPDLAEISVSYNWEWDYIPFWTMTDKYGVAWSGDWEPLTHTSKHAYTAIAEDGPGSVVATSGGVTQTGYDTFDPAAGIGWAANLVTGFTKNGTNYHTTKHKGWGQVNAQKQHDGSGRNDINSAVGNYFHRTGTCSGTLSFSVSDGKPSVGISCSWMFDKSSDEATNINWRHSDNP